MNSMFSSEEVLKRPSSSTFFIIVSFTKLDIYFLTRDYCRRMFSKIYMESGAMPKWTLDVAEKFYSKVGETTKIIAFSQRIHREELPDLKKKCISIQEKLKKKDDSIRLIPGYLSPHNIILSSSNDDFHRVYMYHGVYAEVIYKYEKLELQIVDTAPEFFYSKDVSFFFSALRDYHNNSNLKK
jgi:hypothetical protein